MKKDGLRIKGSLGILEINFDSKPNRPRSWANCLMLPEVWVLRGQTDGRLQECANWPLHRPERQIARSHAPEFLEVYVARWKTLVRCALEKATPQLPCS